MKQVYNKTFLKELIKKMKWVKLDLDVNFSNETTKKKAIKPFKINPDSYFFKVLNNLDSD